MRRARTLPPLDGPALERLALAYVQRFQTSRARLRRHLERKLAARGWAGEEAPPLEALCERLAGLGLVDDRAFAEARGRAAAARAHGRSRLRLALAADGIDEADSAPALEGLDPLAQAIAFARRRRFGPFGPPGLDRQGRARQVAAMLRAGHPPDLARRIVDARDIEALEALAEEGF